MMKMKTKNNLRLPEGVTRICWVPQCDHKAIAKDMCSAHYQQNRNGTLWQSLITYAYTCRCGKTGPFKTSCKYCYGVEYRGIETDAGPVQPYGPHAGEPNPYDQVHYLLKRDRGRAAEFDCHAHPEHAAQEWALIPGRATGSCPRNGRTYEYSMNLNDYMPMCAAAHRKMDQDWTKVYYNGDGH